MIIKEYWVICIWSDVRGEWCEQHENYPSEHEAIRAVKASECQGFYKVEKQYQLIK